MSFSRSAAPASTTIPARILQEQMMAALYANHPYGMPIIGWEHEIAALDRDDALSYYKRFYAPNNAILVVAGDVEPDEVRKLAEETYGKLAPNGALNGTPPAAGARALRAGEGDAGRSARRAHHRAALLSRPELRLGRARRGRGARPADAHRGRGLGEQDLQADGDRGQAGRQCRRLVFRFGPRFRQARLLRHRRRKGRRRGARQGDLRGDRGAQAERRHARRARPRARLLSSPSSSIPPTASRAWRAITAGGSPPA